MAMASILPGGGGGGGGGGSRELHGFFQRLRRDLAGDGRPFGDREIFIAAADRHEIDFGRVPRAKICRA